MLRPERRLELAAASALGLTLAVVFAAAAIRLETGIPGLRVVHRIAASLEVIVVLWLGWMTWRVRAAQPGGYGATLVAIALTALLSIVGIAAGRKPPPAAVAVNLLGGFMLAAVLAWILGTRGSLRNKALTPILLIVAALMTIQLVLGARLSIIERLGPVLPVHALLAMALAALIAWVASVRIRGAAGRALFALALAAPVAGFTALHYEWSAGAALAHSAAAALLLVSTAFALGRAA